MLPPAERRILHGPDSEVNAEVLLSSPAPSLFNQPLAKPSDLPTPAKLGRNLDGTGKSQQTPLYLDVQSVASP
jgi:hypothetical protein